MTNVGHDSEVDHSNRITGKILSSLVLDLDRFIGIDGRTEASVDGLGSNTLILKIGKDFEPLGTVRLNFIFTIKSYGFLFRTSMDSS